MTADLVATQLREQGFALQTPFRLELASTGPNIIENQKITCTEILRNLPGRRLVCKGEWQEKTVVAKLFLHPQKKIADYQNEITGYQKLSNAAVLTPTIIWHGRDKQQMIQIILFEFIDTGQTLADYLYNANHDINQQQLILKKTLDSIRIMHHNGLCQQDIHLNNFFVKEDEVYVLDVGDIRATQHSKSLSKRDAYQNLLLFFAEFPPQFDAYSQQLFTYYNQSTNFAINISRKKLRNDIQQERLKRLRQYHRKIFRNCSEFRVEKISALSCVVKRNQFDTIQKIVAEFDSLILRSEILKKGSQTTVHRIFINHQTFIIKHYHPKNFWHAVLQRFKTSRARKSWKNGLTLDFYHFSTAHPLALLEKSDGPCKRHSYLVMEDISGQSIIKTLRAIENPVDFAKIVDQMANLLNHLKSVKISHNDLKSTNILIQNGLLYLIDVDAMQIHRTDFFFQRHHKKDITRFLQNWQNDPKIAIAFKTKLLNQSAANENTRF